MMMSTLTANTMIRTEGTTQLRSYDSPRPSLWVRMMTLASMVLLLVLAPSATSQPLTSMRRICKLRRNATLDQAHVLPVFRTAEDRLRFQLEAYEYSPLYIAGAIAPHVAQELFTEADVLSTLERRYSMRSENSEGQDHATTVDGSKATFPETFEPATGQRAPVADQVTRSVRAHTLKLLASRNSMVLHGVHEHHRKIAAIVNGLYPSVFATAEINVYVSPPKSSPALKLHHDVMDVFIIQAHGKKTWNLYPPVFPLPLADQFPEQFPNFEYSVLQRAKEHEQWSSGDGHHTRFSEYANSSSLPVQVTLGPGDVLYLPRGTPHHAVSSDQDIQSGVKQGVRGGPKSSAGDTGSQTSIHLTVGIVSMPYTVEEYLHSGVEVMREQGQITEEQTGSLHQMLENMARGKFDEEEPNQATLQNEYHFNHLDDEDFVISDSTSLLRSSFLFSLFAPRTFSPVYSPCVKKMNIVPDGDDEKAVVELYCSTLSAGSDTSEEELEVATGRQQTGSTISTVQSLEERKTELQAAQIRKLSAAIHCFSFQVEQIYGAGLAQSLRRHFHVGTNVKITNTKQGLVARVSNSPSLEESISGHASVCTDTDSPKFTVHIGAFLFAKKFLSFVVPEKSRPKSSSVDYSVEPVSFDYKMASYEEGEIGKKYYDNTKNDSRPFISLLERPQHLEDIDIENTWYRRRSDISALVIPADQGADHWRNAASQLYYVPQLARTNQSVTNLHQTVRQLCRNSPEHKRYAVWVQGSAPIITPRFFAKLAEVALMHPPGIAFTPLDLCLDVMSSRSSTQHKSSVSAKDAVEKFDSDYSVCFSKKVETISKMAVDSLAHLGAIGIDSGNWHPQDPVEIRDWDAGL